MFRVPEVRVAELRVSSAVRGAAGNLRRRFTLSLAPPNRPVNRRRTGVAPIDYPRFHRVEGHNPRASFYDPAKA